MPIGARLVLGVTGRRVLDVASLYNAGKERYVVSVRARAFLYVREHMHG